MKKNLSLLAQAVYPVPVMIMLSYDQKMAELDATAEHTWGMICSSDRIALFVASGDHKTTPESFESQAFYGQHRGSRTYGCGGFLRHCHRNQNAG